MVTLTEKGILIEMPGRYYDAETIQSLTNELIEVLRYTLFYNAEIANTAKTNYSYLFDLLLALTPTEEQLKLIHLH